MYNVGGPIVAVSLQHADKCGPKIKKSVDLRHVIMANRVKSLSLVKRKHCSWDIMVVCISNGFDYVNQHFLDVFKGSKSLLGPAIDDVNTFFKPVINSARYCFIEA